MEIDINLISKTMNHLTDIHDKLVEIKIEHKIFMIDGYIKVLDRCINDLSTLKYRASNAQEYLDKEDSKI